MLHFVSRKLMWGVNDDGISVHDGGESTTSSVTRPPSMSSGGSEVALYLIPMKPRFYDLAGVKYCSFGEKRMSTMW